jgi:hypothetical protein
LAKNVNAAFEYMGGIINQVVSSSSPSFRFDSFFEIIQLTKLTISKMPSSTGWVQSMVNLRFNFFFLATLGPFFGTFFFGAFAAAF